jgi:hypothetical protein
MKHNIYYETFSFSKFTVNGLQFTENAEYRVMTKSLPRKPMVGK